MATCRGCNAKIVWAVTEHGKSMPVDAEPDDDGNVIFLAGRRGVGPHGPVPLVKVLPADGQLELVEDASIDGRRYMPHFATCPKRDEFRRRPR